MAVAQSLCRAFWMHGLHVGRWLCETFLRPSRTSTTTPPHCLCPVPEKFSALCRASWRFTFCCRSSSRSLDFSFSSQVRVSIVSLSFFSEAFDACCWAKICPSRICSWWVRFDWYCFRRSDTWSTKPQRIKTQPLLSSTNAVPGCPEH